MKFNYIARTKTGDIRSGVVEAASKDAAINLLQTYQLYVTTLEEAGVPIYARRIRILERIPRKDIVAFSRQLAIMFKSEISLVETLETLARQTPNRLLRDKILEMVEKVEGGDLLSKTFAQYPEIFDSFYINMVRAGESSGKLAEVFSYLADYIEKEYYFKSRITGIMIYPAFILAVFVGVVLLMVFFVIPNLESLLTESGGELPIITKMLVAVFHFFKQWGLLLLLLIIGTVVGGIYYFRTPEGKVVYDRSILKVPLLKSFLKKTYLSRIALNLSTLISGGLPIMQALEITGDVVGNDVYKRILAETSEGVRRGEQISSLLQAHPEQVAPLFIQMIVVGEKTGRLESSLTNVVDFYQKEVDRAVDNFSRLLEPIMILFLAGAVGLLMAAVVMPLYQAVGNF